MTIIFCSKHIDVLTLRIVVCSLLFSISLLFVFRAGANLWVSLEYFLLLVISIKFGYFISRMLWPRNKVSSENKAVLITGCDSGFGFLLSKRLAKAGFRVFAGCLDPERSGGLELRSDACKNVLTFKLDVTRQEDVDDALEFVAENLNGSALWAVVNNAGISKGSEIEMTSTNKIQDILEVNLLGVIRVSKAFLPQLRQSQGRIVTVASASGRFMMPGFVPYSLSKHAVIAFCDGLRLELHKFGVKIVTIEPWIYKTRLSNTSSISKTIERQWEENPTEIKGAYDRDYITRLQRHTSTVFDYFANPNVDDVIDDMESAITAEQPNYYYRPGRWYLNAWLNVTNSLPKPIADCIVCNCIFRNHALNLEEK